MKLLKSSIIFCVILIALPAEAYRILGLFLSNTKSHFIMFKRLMKGLAERGHQVDVVSHFPLRSPFPNYNDAISLAGTVPDLVNNMTLDAVHGFQNYVSEPYAVAFLFGSTLCHLMDEPRFRDLIRNPPKNPPYDLVVTEIFGSHCYLAMGQHFEVPVVGVTSSIMFPWTNDFVANPDNPAYIPNVYSLYDARMNFWQRVTNTLTNLKVKWEFNQGSEAQTDSINKYIGPHAPSVREAEKSVSLILVNSHYSLNGVRPFTAAVVEVGGLHIDDREAIVPNDLQKWLDDSEDGFVYVSFGSMIKIESFPEETLSVIYASLAKLAPIQVLMKIATPEELPPGLPINVLTRPWLPQSTVLRHKNIRAFVTHGGLMGTQEAIYYGVPMIGVPLFGDQGLNINRYSQMNMAVAVDYQKLTVARLDAAFHAVLHDPSYKKATMKMSELFRDRPMSPSDTAIFWIEYVIRNGGTSLRSPAMNLTWWQTALFDVYAFLFLSIILAMGCLLFVITKLRIVFHHIIAKTSTRRKKVE